MHSLTPMSSSVRRLPHETQLATTISLQTAALDYGVMDFPPQIKVRSLRVKKTSPTLIHPSVHVIDMIDVIANDNLRAYAA